MKYAVIVLLGLLALASALRTEQEYQREFTKWMRVNQRSYSHDDFRNRYNIFKANLDSIEAKNAQGGAKFAMNKFGDLTPEEFKTLHVGKIKSAPRTRYVQTLDTTALPSSVNWNTAGAVTHIKNQGQCGSCWSFSATGSLEGINFITNKNLLSFSEEQLVDCAGGSWGNDGCDGGLMDYAFTYTNSQGIELESEYPYTAGEGQAGTCNYQASQVKFTNKGGQGQGYTDVAANDESQLQAAVAQQPVSVAIEADQSCFQFYTSGVLTASNCACGTSLDHGVLAVGYDTDPSAGPYWIVKNSWGADWGNQGFVWLQRGGAGAQGMCGIAMDPSYATAN